MFANSAVQSRTSFLAIYISAANSKITLESQDKKRGLMFTRITLVRSNGKNQQNIARLRRHGTNNENRVARYRSYVRKQTRFAVEGMDSAWYQVVSRLYEPQTTDSFTMLGLYK